MFTVLLTVLSHVCDHDRRCPMCIRGEIDCSECLASIPCVEIAHDVRMPVLGLGTGASAFGSQCWEPEPNPPFTNETCFKRQARLAAAEWIGRGGGLLETAQDDLNQVPVGAAIAESQVDPSELFVMCALQIDESYRLLA